MSSLRLIDANALMEDIELCRGGMFHSAIEREIHDDKIDFALDAVREAPTVEAELVRHGRWVMAEYEYFDCSACNWSYYNGCDSTKEAKRKLENGDYYQFCPNCGAKMDAKEEPAK